MQIWAKQGAPRRVHMHEYNLFHAIGAGLSYGQEWARGDIIGVMIDLDMGTISFMRNGVSLGQAFSHIRRLEYYPAASLSYGEHVTLCFQEPTKRCHVL